jgi:translocation and assembly module TamA
MRLGRSPWRQKLAAALVLVAISGAGLPHPAMAFDFFGLFGSDDPPAPSPAALPYALSFEVRGDEHVETRLRDASNLYRLRQDAPPDGDTLLQRANADFGPLIDALWGAGYYDATVAIEIAGVRVQIGQFQNPAAVRAANGLRNRAPVPVKIVAETGPLFRLRKIEVLDQATRAPFPPEELPPYLLRLKPGDPAESASIRAATARLVDHFRRRSYPLVKSPPPAPVVDHAADSMDVTFLVDPGPKAGIGEVALSGPKGFDPSIVRSFIYLEEGEPYSPERLDSTRKTIGSIPAVGSVRIREGDQLDRNGNLPIFVDVTDRALNAAGYALGYSTIDGPNGRVYYEHRNLFGGAERLRLQADLFQAPRNSGRPIKNIGDFTTSDAGGRATFSFLKPAIDGTRFDFLVDGLAERNRIGSVRFGGYTVRLGGGTAALRYRVDETLSATLGIKGERGRTSDSVSNVDYTLVGVPLTMQFDNTDSPLDPKRGVRVSAAVTPYPAFMGSSVAFTQATAAASAYYSFDEEGRFVLAARGRVGGFLDEPDRLQLIPSNYRYFVGGAGSIRGYRFQSVSPFGPTGRIVGGRSMFDASLEARIKVTDTIGIVPFFDAGGAYASQFPDFFGDTRMSAGLGVFYVTAIGPIRLDVAAPLNPRRGDNAVVLYVNIGQAF